MTDQPDARSAARQLFSAGWQAGLYATDKYGEQLETEDEAWESHRAARGEPTIGYREGYRAALEAVFCVLEGVEFDFRVQRELHALRVQLAAPIITARLTTLADPAPGQLVVDLRYGSTHHRIEGPMGLYPAGVAEILAAVQAALDREVATPPDNDRIYPCDKCEVLRTKAEGGTVFTVCEACWDKDTAPPVETGAPTDDHVTDMPVDRGDAERAEVATERALAPPWPFSVEQLEAMAKATAGAYIENGGTLAAMLRSAAALRREVASLTENTKTIDQLTHEWTRDVRQWQKRAEKAEREVARLIKDRDNWKEQWQVVAEAHFGPRMR